MDTPPARPATLIDVAEQAGVSVPTASRVLNGGVRGKGGGRPELRERVIDAAKRLGYAPSAAAQAIKDGRARSIALLVSDIDNIGAAQMIAGVMHAAEERGAPVSVRATKDDPDRELRLLNELRGDRHRAVIIATSRSTDAEREAAVGDALATLSAEGAQIVVIGSEDLPFPSVTVDTFPAAQQLATGLVDVGHRRFAIVAGPADMITSRARCEGFLSGLENRGIARDEVIVVHEEFSREGGIAAVAELADRLPGLDVIAAMSDAVATGVIACLRRHGLNVPADITVTGFDHSPVLGDLLDRFSTVDVPFSGFGEAALTLALDDPSVDATSRIALHATTILEGSPLPPAD